MLRPRLSADHPGKLQHTFELIYDFLREQADEQVGHDGHQYVAYFGTIFIFILFSNLIGVIPGMESPTMVPSVPAGCAHGDVFLLQHRGRSGQRHRASTWRISPDRCLLLAPLMIPIELVSHLARPLSLTIRLFANMYAGEQVTMVFLKLTFLLVPAVFMGLHVFVSFLQAYIFMLLTMMYVAGAVSHEH